MLRFWRQRMTCGVYSVFLPKSPHSQIKLFQALRFIGLQPFCITHSHSCTQNSNKNIATFLKSQTIAMVTCPGSHFCHWWAVLRPKKPLQFCRFFFYVVLSGSMGRNPHKSHNLPMSLLEMKTLCIDLYLLHCFSFTQIWIFLHIRWGKATLHGILSLPYLLFI